MLKRENRMVSRADFTRTMRGGARGHSRLFIVHYLPSPAATKDLATELSATKVGVMVAKRAVKLAVNRNYVKRRVRHIMTHLIQDVPAGSRIVVRALPPAAAATSGEMLAALTKALRQAQQKWERKTSGSTC